MPILRRSLLAAGAVAPVAGPAFGQGLPERGRRRWSREMPILRVGLPSVQADGGALARFDGYARQLETTFGIPVSTFQPASEAEMAQAFAGGMIDFAFMSPMGYAAAWIETGGAVEPFLATINADGSRGTVSVIIVRSDSWIMDLEMLRRRSFAWVARDSMDGFLLPRLELRARGIDPDTYFGTTSFAGSHERAILDVVTRRVDGAVTWASGAGEPEEGFSRSTMRDLAQARQINLSELRVLWQSDLIPNAPVVIRRDVPEGFRNDIFNFHMALPTARPDILRSLGIPGWDPAAPQVYERFVQLRQDLADQSRRTEEQRRREEETRFAAEEQKRREEAAKRRRELAAERRRRFEAQFR